MPMGWAGKVRNRAQYPRDYGGLTGGWELALNLAVVYSLKSLEFGKSRKVNTCGGRNSCAKTFLGNVFSKKTLSKGMIPEKKKNGIDSEEPVWGQFLG